MLFSQVPERISKDKDSIISIYNAEPWLNSPRFDILDEVLRTNPDIIKVAIRHRYKSEINLKDIPIDLKKDIEVVKLMINASMLSYENLDLDTKLTLHEEGWKPQLSEEASLFLNQPSDISFSVLELDEQLIIRNHVFNYFKSRDNFYQDDFYNFLECKTAILSFDVKKAKGRI